MTLFYLYFAVFVILLWIPVIYLYCRFSYKKVKEGFQSSYLDTLNKHKTEGHFPFRYLCDEKQNILPIVLVAAFFRSDKERALYDEYIKHGIKVVGITAYKTFPKPITDKTGDLDTKNDPFDYYGKIQNWLSCFDNPSHYGLGSSHQIANISESDFYDAESSKVADKDKKYDFVYVCLKDDDQCSMDGWNAVNRNFKLAMECFPIMIHEMGLSVLVIGRTNCGLEKLYGDKIVVKDFLPYHEFQQVLRESRILFVPNVYDASPRVISESLIKGLPVLLNRGIVCGAKYITDETGELFFDQHDVRLSIEKLLAKKNRIDPQKWWKEHYSRQSSGKKLKNILNDWYPNVLTHVSEVYFY